MASTKLLQNAELLGILKSQFNNDCSLYEVLVNSPLRLSGDQEKWKMNEWAARIMSVFPERNKADLDEFVQQITHDKAEHMYFNKEYNAEVECRPTFEQLSHERILAEVNKSINTLKVLENIVNDRMIGYNSLHSSLTKTHTSYEQLDHSDGTLKVALDALYIFTEQEIAQCKQHVFLGDLRKSLSEMRVDAIRRINDYQKEIHSAEKEVTTAEKKLAKTKEALERSSDYKSKMESFELDVILNTSRPAVTNASGNPSVRSSKDSTPGNLIPTTTGSSTNSLTGTEDSVTRIERELRDDIRLLLRTIEQRDDLYAASRRAFQKLHRDCKNVTHISLLKISEKEEEYAYERRQVLEKLSLAVKNVDIEVDEREFIETHSGREGALVLTSQALRLLNDLVPPTLPTEAMDVGTHGGRRSGGMYPYAENGVDARTSRDPRDRPVSPQLQRSDSAQGRSPQTSSPPPLSNSRSKPSTSTPTSTTPTSAASSTPSSSRFSFRRTLGLISDPKDTHVPAPALPTLPTVATAIPSTSSSVANTAHMPTSVDIPAGRVGGQSSSKSNNNNSHSSSSVSCTIVPSAAKAEFTEFLTQIFYPPKPTATSATQLSTEEPKKNAFPTTTTTTTGASTTTSTATQANNNIIQSIDVPSFSRSASSTEESAAATGTAANTPKIMIDDNYFLDPELESTDSNNSTKHEEKISFLKKPAPDVLIRKDGNTIETTVRKSVNRSMTVRKSDLHCGALDWLRSNPASYLITAVEGISRVIKTQSGRDAFTTELNQFRSRKVELGEEGFDALAMVLWTALTHCQSENDVHNASVIMMLSQTFYRRKSQPPVPSDATPCSPLTPSDKARSEAAAVSDEDEEDEEDSARGVEHRKYIKDLLIPHPIWRDGNFWEQTLWQCAIEQLQTIPYDRAWHDMNKDMRRQAVRRVHEVIFSQVMAVTHSMMEMGCSAEQSREFLYRMCVIHQLSEDMRHSLLKHVAATSLANVRRHSKGSMLGTAGGGCFEQTSTAAKPISSSTSTNETLNSAQTLPPPPPLLEQHGGVENSETITNKNDSYSNVDIVSV